MTTQVEVTHEEHVSRVRFVGGKGIQLFGRPAREQLTAAVEQLESRKECRVVVFEAEGRTFIAGADIKELQTLDPASARHLANEMHALFDRLEALPAVSIAAIHAACAGGGLELALACDLRFAAESAKLGLPEVTLGLIPGWGGTVRMTNLFGPAVARHVIFRGELMSADDAAKLGLVTAVVPDDEFREFIDRQVAMIASRSPNAIGTTKALLRSYQKSISSGFNAEAEAFGRCYESPEADEGIKAFLEKRSPVWNSAE